MVVVLPKVVPCLYQPHSLGSRREILESPGFDVPLLDACIILCIGLYDLQTVNDVPANLPGNERVQGSL